MTRTERLTGLLHALWVLPATLINGLFWRCLHSDWHAPYTREPR